MPAVNSNTYSSLGDLLTAEALDPSVILLLGERNNIPRHPAIFMAEPVDAIGSATRKVSHVGLYAYDLPGVMADGGVVPLTSFSDGSTTLTVTRYTKAYGWTDLARMTLPDGRIDPDILALDAITSMNARATDLICDVVDGFSAQSGPGTGVDLDVASVMALIGAGAVGNLPGPAFMGLLHGQQWSDLIVDGGTSIGSAGGGTQNYNAQLAAMQELRGTGYVGSWLGVDWFRNNRVKTINAGADRAGALFAQGGVIGLLGMFVRGVDDPANQVLVGGSGEDGNAGVILFERSRDAFSAETAFVCHGYMAWAKGVEAGITLVSDA
jgi:hypothetical protein